MAVRLYLKRFATFACAVLILTSGAHAQAGSFNDDVERGSFGSSNAVVTTTRLMTYSPVRLGNGSSLNVAAPPHFSHQAQKLGRDLLETHKEFKRLFGDIPTFKSVVRLMDEDEFYQDTGAPRWTNAMFYRGEIIIPLSQTKIDEENLTRSVKHEFTHAVIHALSDGKCPGWLDEGLAQWVEGYPNPALKPALANWLTSHKPVSLDLLQGGFTKLDPKMVPAAYAQSLFAARDILKTYGMGKVRTYFSLLRDGHNHDSAFRESFGLSERAYEGQLAARLRQWLSTFRRQ